MNFLEQIVSEWYAYKGYFVKTNIKFGNKNLRIEFKNICKRQT